MEEIIEKIEKMDKRKFNGGARAGAGMPKGKKTRKTLIKEKAQEYLTRRIEEAIEPLATALIEKAIEKDVSALKEAFERGLGKVKDVHDVNVREVKPILGGITNVQGNDSTEETTETS